MALFKIFKGSSENLGVTGGTDKTKEGYAYFTPDDGRFYIDVDENKTPIIGGKDDNKTQNRICINDYFVLDCGGAFDE